MKKSLPAQRSLGLNHQRGAVIILVALLMVVFLGIAALVIDLSTQYVVRNELQNAADAGALGGARVLYLAGGEAVNPGANQEAIDAAKENIAMSVDGSISVDVNPDEVERGHWSFATRSFTPNDSLEAVDLWNLTTEELDDPNSGFINAIRVKVRRIDTPAPSFFARIFGYQDFAMANHSVAYLGFAGTLMPEDLDQPIGVCQQSILEDDETLACSTGRMTNSGGNADTHNTAAWTNFSQPCQTASVPTVRPLVCGEGNPEVVNLGQGIGSTGGEMANVARDLRDCWMNDPALLKDFRDYPRERWSITLPVIDCPGNNPGNCSEVVGAVSLDIIWINDGGADPDFIEVPMEMEHWECSLWVDAGKPTPTNPRHLLDDETREACWKEFAEEFNLLTAGGNSVGDLTHDELKSAIYFLPDCSPQEPRGVTGGDNFGILAEIPVLVE